MDYLRSVYRMEYSSEDERPRIDLEKQDLEWDDWGDLDQKFPEGADTIQSPPTLHFHVDAPDALNWDWYGRAGGWGMWSWRAKDLLWPYARQHLRCFQTTLNGAPYYILRVDEELAIDALDWERSDLELFDSTGRIMEVKRYVLRSGFTHDPLIFHVKGFPDILCTESIRHIATDAGLHGFEFVEAGSIEAEHKNS